MSIRNPQQESVDKALKSLISKDPPGTLYQLEHQTVWIAGNKVQILMLNVKHKTT